ncbi:hypothetical protein PLEOSDRAFT_1105951 [Pleurotus ostreatus PC15]|uniref:Uncharacterized protein n=1 Tax=Pleurotus ostreatus (strain PC15) TaxID=1137138 RepID=A0A067NSH8_PLEO1|nr:hypothetical protein PLEOSDRAFT_1105951 [Pleurotus ostreatus PC15]
MSPISAPPSIPLPPTPVAGTTSCVDMWNKGMSGQRVLYLSAAPQLCGAQVCVRSVSSTASRSTTKSEKSTKRSRRQCAIVSAGRGEIIDEGQENKVMSQEEKAAKRSRRQMAVITNGRADIKDVEVKPRVKVSVSKGPVPSSPSKFRTPEYLRFLELKKRNQQMYWPTELEFSKMNGNEVPAGLGI